MVQKGYCRDPFTAATEACRRRRWGEENGRSSVTCFSPWSVISCWLSVRKSKARKNLDGHCFLEDKVEENKIVLGCLDGHSSNAAPEVSGDENRKEATLGLGVGFGLIYLMATSNNEIKKLAELCQQMESLLQNVKREFQDDQGKDTGINDSYSTPKAQEQFSGFAIENASLQDCPSYSWGQDYSEPDVTPSRRNSRSKMTGKGRKLEMDELEAQLEAEFEHLQLNYSNQKHSNSEIVVEGNAQEESINTSFDQAIERVEIENMEHKGGVHPRVLERRLHELQEVRQKERIRELELALGYAINNPL